jgi:hypothetical protein
MLLVMGHAAESLEHAEHVAHSGHGGDRLSMSIGITMALLGVLLAFSAAKVGGVRTELVQALVDQQHAHALHQAQDVKHRVAVLALQNLHAEADPARTNAKDMVAMANSVERYDKEAKAAVEWVDAYDPIIETEVESQEHYERGQLAAEFGIVIASIALLLRRRSLWGVAIALGGLSVVLIAMTWWHAHGAVHHAEEVIAADEKVFYDLRAADKTTDVDQALVDEVKKTYGPAAAGSATPR